MKNFGHILASTQRTFLGKDARDLGSYEGGGFSFLDEDLIMEYANRALRALEKRIFRIRKDGEIFQAPHKMTITPDMEYITLPEDAFSARVIHIHIADPITHVGEIENNEKQDVILKNILATIFSTTYYSFVYKILNVGGEWRLYIYPGDNVSRVDLDVEIWYVRKMTEFQDKDSVLELELAYDWILAYIAVLVNNYDLHQYGNANPISKYDEEFKKQDMLLEQALVPFISNNKAVRADGDKLMEDMT